MIQDITEHRLKKAEKELKESNDYLNNLFNYANAPIIVWDQDFKIDRFNHAFEYLTGRSYKTILHTAMDGFYLVDTQGRIRDVNDSYCSLIGYSREELLMDIGLPGIDGIETARRIKDKPEYHKTPIIAVTAFAMKGDRERFLERGFDHYLSKPINVTAFINLMKDVLKKESEHESE
jgi:CheY-like chemotaxis protein